MAPTPTLVASAVVLPFPSRMPWETCRCRGRLCVGTSALRISARPLSGTAYRLDYRRGRMEPHKGAKALHNESEDSRNSSTRVKSARRIRPGKGRRIGKGVVIERPAAA